MEGVVTMNCRGEYLNKPNHILFKCPTGFCEIGFKYPTSGEVSMIIFKKSYKINQ
jgi:hypothetical protein